jgi:hypothetical protein
VPALRLVAFDDCADLLSGLRAAARESVGPYGLPGDRNFEYAMAEAVPGAKAAAGAAHGNSAIDSVQALPAPLADVRLGWRLAEKFRGTCRYARRPCP